MRRFGEMMCVCSQGVVKRSALCKNYVVLITSWRTYKFLSEHSLSETHSQSGVTSVKLADRAMTENVAKAPINPGSENIYLAL